MSELMKTSKETMKTILVLGATGRLGSHLTPYLLKDSSFTVKTHSSSKGNTDYISDLTQEAGVHEVLKQSAPDVIVNLIAFTNVDQAEVNKEKAYALNARPIQHLLKFIEEYNFKLIQISTDHIYDQKDSDESNLKIRNYYAESKLIGEEAARKCEGLILRTNFFGDFKNGTGLYNWALKNLSENKTIHGFDNVFFSPLHVTTLCREIALRISDFKADTFNIGSKLGMSKYEFLRRLAVKKGFDKNLIQPQKYDPSAVGTIRPLDMRMSVEKYENAFRSSLPTLASEIEKC
jgi:dTDP-4-dehydrorhamnose reductase